MAERGSRYFHLVEKFLRRPNSTTVRHYRAALADFALYCKAPSTEVAVQKLLGREFKAANRLARAYQLNMLGTRDQSGKLKSGRGLSPNAINLRTSVLRSLAKKAHRQGLVNWQLEVKNLPTENVRPSAGPGLEVLNRMLEAARQQHGVRGYRDYALLRLAGELGLRRKELVELDVDDFDGHQRTVAIRGMARRQKDILGCTGKTAAAIQEWLRVRPATKKDHPLFTNAIPGRPTRLSGTAIYELVRRLGAEVLPRGSRKAVRPHDIRHTAITEAVRRAKDAGLASEEVQRFSRHRDFRMVAKYLDADRGAQSRLAQQVGNCLV